MAQAPRAILRPFGVDRLGTDARNEVRAVHGGFGIAIAVLLLATEYLASLRSGVLITIAVALAGMAAGRVIGWGVDRRIGVVPALFMLVELLLAAALLLAVER